MYVCMYFTSIIGLFRLLGRNFITITLLKIWYLGDYCRVAGRKTAYLTDSFFLHGYHNSALAQMLLYLT